MTWAIIDFDCEFIAVQRAILLVHRRFAHRYSIENASSFLETVEILGSRFFPNWQSLSSISFQSDSMTKCFSCEVCLRRKLPSITIPSIVQEMIAGRFSLSCHISEIAMVILVLPSVHRQGKRENEQGKTRNRCPHGVPWQLAAYMP
jgi:hypothetical protein